MKITTAKQARVRLKGWCACGSLKGRSMKEIWDRADIWDKRWILRRLMWKRRLDTDTLILQQYEPPYRTTRETITYTRKYIRRLGWRTIRAAFVK